jgi:hypothetical protein
MVRKCPSSAEESHELSDLPPAKAYNKDEGVEWIGVKTPGTPSKSER